MSSVSGVKVGLGLRIRIGHVLPIDLLNNYSVDIGGSTVL